MDKKIQNEGIKVFDDNKKVNIPRERIAEIRGLLKGIHNMNAEQRADLKSNIREEQSTLVDVDTSLNKVVPPIIGAVATVGAALYANHAGLDMARTVIGSGLSGFVGLVGSTLPEILTESVVPINFRIKKFNKYMFNPKVNRKRRADMKLAEAYEDHKAAPNREAEATAQLKKAIQKNPLSALSI